jgi:hypothetical protein
LTVNHNAIGEPNMSIAPKLRDGATTGVSVKQGVYAAIDGRWGQVTSDPDHNNEVYIKWLDDGSTSRGYTKARKVTELNPVVSSQADLVEDYSHIEQLGQAITRLSSLDISSCSFNPVSLATFTSSVTWADAALARVSVLSNPIGADGADALIQVFNENAKLRTLLGIEEGVTELNLSKNNVDPGQAKILAAELKASRAVAEVKSLALCETSIIGLDVLGRGTEDLSGFEQLCAVIGKLHELNLSKCKLNPAAITIFATKVTWAEAVLKDVDMSGTGCGGYHPIYTSSRAHL